MDAALKPLWIARWRSGLPARRTRRRLYWVLGIGMVALLLPLAFWFAVWHGSSALDAGDIANGLGEPVRSSLASRHLLQLGAAMSRGNPGARAFYSRIVELSRFPDSALRQTAAWAMGRDPAYPPFQAALLERLADPNPMVRRAAAASLAGFHHPAAKPVLSEMLAPYAVPATAAGTFRWLVQPGDTTTPDTVIARIGETGITAGVPGRVARYLIQEHAIVTPGQPMLELDPDPEQMRIARGALRRLP